MIRTPTISPAQPHPVANSFVGKITGLPLYTLILPAPAIPYRPTRSIRSVRFHPTRSFESLGIAVAYLPSEWFAHRSTYYCSVGCLPVSTSKNGSGRSTLLGSEEGSIYFRPTATTDNHTIGCDDVIGTRKGRGGLLPYPFFGLLVTFSDRLRWPATVPASDSSGCPTTPSSLVAPSR